MSYTASPIRNLRSQHQHQQQFYRIKANRLQTQNQDLKSQNSILNKKLKELSMISPSYNNTFESSYAYNNNNNNLYATFSNHNQSNSINNTSFNQINNSPYQNLHSKKSSIYKQQQSSIYSLNSQQQNNKKLSPNKRQYKDHINQSTLMLNMNYDSIQFGKHSEIYNNINSSRTRNLQAENLLKQIRVLKNDHEFQITGLKQEIRKLMRNNAQLQNQMLTMKDREESIINPRRSRIHQNQQESLRLNKELLDQKQKVSRLETQKQLLSQKLLEKNKEIIELKYKLQEKEQKNKKQTIRMGQSIMSNNSNMPYTDNEQLRKILYSNYKEIKESSQPKFSKQLKLKQQFIQQLKLQIKVLKNRTKLDSQSQIHKLSKQNKYLQQKVQSLKQQMNQKQQEYVDVLIKLKPLLQDNKKIKDSFSSSIDNKRASLSLLEVLLKKNKIKVFGQ